MSYTLWYPRRGPGRVKEAQRPWWPAEVGRLVARRMKWAEEEGGQAFPCDASADGTCRLTLLLPGGRETYFLNRDEAEAARKEINHSGEAGNVEGAQQGPQAEPGGLWFG